MGHERAHTECVSQSQGLLIVGFSLLGIGGIGVGMDGAQLVQRDRLIPAVLQLPGKVECPARVLPGLFAAARQTTDLAEPCNPKGSLPPAYMDSDADRLLQ